MIKALLIPADPKHPVRVAEIEDTHDEVAQLVFGVHYPSRDELGFSTFSLSLESGVQLAYDDLGLLREPPVQVNDRAMALWALLSGRMTDGFTQPLVGTYVAMGFDETGETIDVPEHYVFVMTTADTMIGESDA